MQYGTSPGSTITWQQIQQLLQNQQQGGQQAAPMSMGSPASIGQNFMKGIGSSGSAPGTGSGLAGIFSGNAPIYGRLGLGTAPVSNPIPSNYGPNSNLQQVAKMTGQDPMSLMPENVNAPGALTPDQLSSGSLNGAGNVNGNLVGPLAGTTTAPVADGGYTAGGGGGGLLDSIFDMFGGSGGGAIGAMGGGG